MNRNKILSNTVDYVKDRLAGHEAGHDWWHVERVWHLAKTIAEHEACDSLVVELGALLHDIADTKFDKNTEEDAQIHCKSFLSTMDLPDESINAVIYIVNHVSYRKSLGDAFHIPIELAVVMDADRLDAMGAIGIARAFSYGGFKGRPFYDPSIPPREHLDKNEYEKRDTATINHFYEKLLRLKDTMNTETGRKMAQERHLFMENYLSQFFKEWEGER